MKPVKQYHFDREDFCNVWKEYFLNCNADGLDLFDIFDLCHDKVETNNFILFYSNIGEEYIIMHKESLTTITWYKHLGRINTCSDPNFTLEDLREFVKLLAEDLKTHPVER